MGHLTRYRSKAGRERTRGDASTSPARVTGSNPVCDAAATSRAANLRPIDTRAKSQFTENATTIAVDPQLPQPTNRRCGNPGTSLLSVGIFDGPPPLQRDAPSRARSTCLSGEDAAPSRVDASAVPCRGSRVGVGSGDHNPIANRGKPLDLPFANGGAAAQTVASRKGSIDPGVFDGRSVPDVGTGWLWPSCAQEITPDAPRPTYWQDQAARRGHSAPVRPRLDLHSGRLCDSRGFGRQSSLSAARWNAPDLAHALTGCSTRVTWEPRRMGGAVRTLAASSHSEYEERSGVDRSPPAPLRSRGLLSDRLGDTGRRRRRFRQRRDRRTAIARRAASVPRLAADDRPPSKRSAARPRPILSRSLLLLVSARLDALGLSRQETSRDDDQRGWLVGRLLRTRTPSPPRRLQMQAAARRSSTRRPENRDSRSPFDTCFPQRFRPPLPVDDRLLLDGPTAPGGLVNSPGRQSALAHRRGPGQRRHADDDPDVGGKTLKIEGA